MEPGDVGTAAKPGRGRLVMLAWTASVVLAAGVLVGVANRSSAKPERAAAADAGRQRPATTTISAPETTTTTVAPTTTTVAPPPETTTTTAAPAPPAPTAVPPPQVSARARAAPVTPTTAALPLTLAAGLDQALGATPGCLVVEEGGVTKFERNPTQPFVPASSQKLLVAAAALARLGPDFRYETKVVAAARPGADGRLDGAWLVGAGDPFLATPDYQSYAAGRPRLNTLPLTPMVALADALVAAGVRDVPGGFGYDDSWHDTQRSVPTWKPSYVRQAEVGSLGALTVNEGFAAFGRSQRVAGDPAFDAAGALTRLLAERNVTGPAPAMGGPRSAPDRAVVIASVRSAPLGDIVAAMLRASDNFAAETIMREVDRQTGGIGSTAGGAAAVLDQISRVGVDTTGVHLNDGSGLDTGNRSTCRALLGAVNLSARPGFSAIADGLAVAGRTGTLAARFVGSPVEGRLAAKTGWINGASALVGRIDALAPQPARRFALVVNGNFAYATGAALQARVVGVLATALPWG